MLSSMRAEIQILQQTKCDLEDTVAVTQAQLESLRCQNENDCKDLKEKIHYLESSKKELANELSQSKEVLDKETSRLEQQLSDYVTQLQSVEQKLTANAQLLSSSKIEQDEKVSSLKIEIGELERCKGELKGTIQLKISELSALKAANTESESVLHATIDSLQREKDAYEALVIAKDRVLTETAAEYHQKVMKLEKNLADLQIIQSELEESVCQRDDQLIKFKLEYDSLHTELVSSICEKEGLERTIIEKDRSFLEMTEVKEGQLANLKIEMIALELERKAELQRVEDVAHSVALELQAKCNELSDAELGFQTTQAELESEINELAASKLALEALLASNTDDATKAIECRMREVSSLKGELSDLLTSKYQLEKQLSEKDKILAKLNAEYVSEKAQFQQEISKLLAIKEQLENSNQENRNLFDLSKTELEKGIQDLTEEVSSLKSERKFLELAITESKAQLDEKANEHNFKVQQLEFEISQCIRSKCDIETELKIAKQIHEEFRTSKTSEIVDIEKRASSLASSKTLFEKTLIEKTNELETSKAAHSEFVKSLQTVLSTTQASVSSLTSLVAEKEGTIINLQASQIELKTQLNDYEKRYVELIEKQQQAEARFSRSVEDKDAFCRQLSDTILNLKNERDKLVEVLATKEVAMNTIQATCEAQNVRSENDLKELKSTIRVLELVNNELEAKNQALLSMTGDFETNINSLKSQVSVLQKKIADLEDDSASKDRDIKCMIVSHEASIVSKKNEIVSLTKTIRSLEVLASENERVVSSKVHTLESSNLALQNKINSFEVQVQHLQKERDTFKELCSLKGEQISSEKLHLSSHLETELYEHKHLLDSAYDALNNTIAEKNEAVDGLQAAANENDRLKETLSSLEVDREDLKSKLSVSESHFVRLKQDYADLVEENKNMIISIGILRERVSVVNNQESMLSEMTSKLIEKDNELSTVHALHLNDVQILTDKVLTLQNHCDKTEFELQAKETAINELKLTQLSQKHVISELTDEINHLTTFFLKKQEPCSLQASYDRAQRMQSFMPSTSLTLKPSMIRRKGTSPNTSPVSSCDMPPISALNFSNVKSPKSPLKSPTRLKRKSITSNAIPPGSLFSFWNQVTFLLVIAVLAAASLVYQFQFPNGHLQLISHDPQVEQQYLLDAPTLKPIPDIDLNSNGVHEKEDRKLDKFLL